MSEIINDLIFSINTVLPVFIVVLVGYVMRKRGTVDEHFVGSISNVVFYYALPDRMFLDHRRK
ncbi:MAG: AEC family transporter [Coprococcus sp.]